MLDLNDIAVFATVAEFGSFSKAARALSMPVSTVSRRLSELERELGVTLLQRTTRKLSLTTQGRDYFSQCREPLKQLTEAERVLTNAQREPQGTLKITVPVLLSDHAFLAFISDFRRRYPGIRVDLNITNQFVDLIAENVDVAIRFGDLKSSSTVAKKLGVNHRLVVAAPRYLSGKAAPKKPEDLATHACVLLSASNNEADWELVSGRKRARVHVSGVVSSSDFRSVSYFTYQGHGVGLLPSTDCDAQIASGNLVRLLPHWTSPPIAVHAVYPSRKFLPERVHAFLEQLSAWRSPFWHKGKP
jgi:DNA-binding transcriptional LysR family regulator